MGALTGSLAWAQPHRCQPASPCSAGKNSNCARHQARDVQIVRGVPRPAMWSVTGEGLAALGPNEQAQEEEKHSPSFSRETPQGGSRVRLGHFV